MYLNLGIFAFEPEGLSAHIWLEPAIVIEQVHISEDIEPCAVDHAFKSLVQSNLLAERSRYVEHKRIQNDPPAFDGS